MKKHNGMRPQDIFILLKIISYGKTGWMFKDLSLALSISPSEVSESLTRSALAGLIDSDRKNVFRKALIEFLEHGIKYVFPQQPGALARGIATAHSAPPINQHITSSDIYIWPDANGNLRGQIIEPLYPTVTQAIKADNLLYELLALTDALRTGKTREQRIAVQELKKRIL